MTRFNRIKEITIGVLGILLSIVMIADTEFGYLTVTVLLSVMLIVYGLKCLAFYVTMARCMVGGQQMLYIGVIVLDLGLFTLTMLDVPKAYVMLYLLLGNAFTGLVSVLRGLEARRMSGTHWRVKLIQGIFFILVSVTCGIFVRSANILVYVFCAQLIYTSVMRIISASRQSAIVYVQ